MDIVIDCLGCLHGAHPKLEGGDLLILTGDYTTRNEEKEWIDFENWLIKQPYREKIMIGGNHDNFLASADEHIMWKYWDKIPHVTYLCDSGTEFEGLKIWGCPWTSRFEGIDPKCCAFTRKNDLELYSKFELIPKDVDILITHGPPFAILDMTKEKKQVGSDTLMAHHITRLRPKLWAWSHIHEAYGQDGPYQWNKTKYVNCSIMNERYQPVNAPIRVVLNGKNLPDS